MKERATASTLVVLSVLSILLMSCDAVKNEGTAMDQDFLIVAIGDSYGSGQGAPDKTIDWCKLRFSPDWDNKRCNRSLNAGTAQAFETLRNNYSVGFKSFACSGASIPKGLLGGYAGSQPGGDPDPPFLPPQIEEVAQLEEELGEDERSIGALTISVGGNDIYFGPIVVACMAPLGLTCDMLQPVVDRKLAELPGRYADLADKIKELDLEDHQVFLTEYPDPTHDQSGEYCDGKPEDDAFRNIEKCEAEWASQYVLAKLNWTLCKIAEQHDWIYVDGIADEFSHNGWCANDPSTDDKENWINTVTDSGKRQGHVRGAMHPDRQGHAVYGKRLAEEIEPLLQGQIPTVKECGDEPLYLALASVCP